MFFYLIPDRVIPAMFYHATLCAAQQQKQFGKFAKLPPDNLCGHKIVGSVIFELPFLCPCRTFPPREGRWRSIHPSSISVGFAGTEGLATSDWYASNYRRSFSDVGGKSLSLVACRCPSYSHAQGRLHSLPSVQTARSKLSLATTLVSA